MTLDKTKIPQHVAILMDGNRRWAKKQGMNILKGHEYVVENVVENLIERCGELGIKYLTLWVFSTENWERDEKEVGGLMQLFRKALQTKVMRFIEKGARLNMIGNIERFPADIQAGLQQAMKASEKNDKIVVTYAMNYGGRDEIVRAVNRYLSNFEDSPRRMTYKDCPQITEQVLEKYLDTAGMPDPDLIIRTGGAQRMSGFMPWQGVYSEYYFTEMLMPEFTVDKFDEALKEYQRRQRRFGK